MSADNRRILIIDDERPILLTLEALLGRHGYQPETAATAAYGLRVLKNNPPALVLLDLQLPDADGLTMLDQIKQEHPETQVIILTAHDSLSNAIESIKRGAYHFISKPYAPEELLSLVEKALEKRSLLRETEALREKTQQLEKRLEIAETRLAPVIKSKAMQELQELINAMAPSEANVLITGESGVGKEVIANVIHTRSLRASKPMVKLNCAAFPQAMIESELFGYVRGAFTGAMNDFPGMIAEASGSTLFLDEISEMPPELQTRFLRVLQEREYRPLGSTKTLKADFRVVAATNRPIPEALADNRLRADLYYRLNTFQIEIPPLRERKEDIPPLVTSFLKRFAQQLGKAEPEIMPEAFQKLLDYQWPGNVRELQNAMEYAVVLARQGQISVKELPAEVQLPVALQKSERKAHMNGGAQNLDDLERNAILAALAQCHGNKKKAAQVLGIQRPTLYNKMKRYAIEL
ncbi:MAG: Response regulator of zinc sigma-54-dependent two-component system [uncultured Chthoniobacterales bacterium]|uniref:Response regulator of zinc sigma-54-dependent two-component system n=1 Tax=uncultured Chthoniobacterales bacterium TaxID=1836801 RepID=A0A6J4HFS1_9BACT|nr:MAG: Response regulator of zinc sigma-54-dependent two-component system [uncultured Chthoniobacterales bacterium]